MRGLQILRLRSLFLNQLLKLLRQLEMQLRRVIMKKPSIC